MFGLALSLVVLISTLSVMNGFERDIRTKLLSRAPHMLVWGQQRLDYEIKSSLATLVQKQDYFYQTKMLLPDYQFQQIQVIFSEAIDKPTVSSSLAAIINTSRPLSLMSFGKKKVLWQPVPHVLSIAPEATKEDDLLTYYLPLSYKERFPELTLLPMVGLWLHDPMLVEQVQRELHNLYPEYTVTSWKDSYSSLFEALHAEKRLIFIVLSMLVVLIYVQLALTLLLIFKEKEKEMISLYFFWRGWPAVYRVFMRYGLLNVTFGTILGCLFGALVSRALPSVVAFLEKTFNMTVLPYEQYSFKQLPSELMMSDVFLVGGGTFLLGFVFCHFLVKKITTQSIERLLRQHQ